MDPRRYHHPMPNPRAFQDVKHPKGKGILKKSIKLYSSTKDTFKERGLLKAYNAHNQSIPWQCGTLNRFSILSMPKLVALIPHYALPIQAKAYWPLLRLEQTIKPGILILFNVRRAATTQKGRSPFHPNFLSNKS
jgi:hypothetical protein